jgi:hypothetical protein
VANSDVSEREVLGREVSPREVADDARDGDLTEGLEPGMSRLAMAGTGAILTSAGTYFYVSWRMLRSPVVDAIGETAGGTLLLLLIISFAGALRRTSRRASRSH